MSTANRVIKNTMFLYIRMGASIIVSVFTTRILLQALGASDYGLYNVVAGALTMLGFLSATMSTSTQRYISYAEGGGEMDKIKSIFNNALIIHWVIGAFVAILFILSGFIFFNGVLNIPEGREQTAIIVYGCLIFSTVFSITITPYDATLNAHENMLTYSIIGILDVILKLVIAIAVFYAKWDQLLFYGILMALESWFIRLITKHYCICHYKECQGTELRNYADKKIIREMASFAGSNLINIATGMISLYGASIIINHFYDTTVNAAWGIAIQVEGVLLALSSNMVKALNPIVVKSEGSGDRQRMVNLSMVGCRFAFLLYAFCGIPVIIAIKPLLALWLKDVPNWTEGFCIIMILATMMEQLYYVFWQALIAEGNVRNYNICRSITNILPIIVSTIMLSQHASPYWVAINWLVFYVFCGGVSTLFFIRKNLAVELLTYLGNVLLRGLATAVVSFVVIFYTFKILYSLQCNIIVIIVLLFVVEVPISYILGLNNQEKHKVLSVLKNRS